MCRKIRYDGESWKDFGFWDELNKASVSGNSIRKTVFFFFPVWLYVHAWLMILAAVFYYYSYNGDGGDLTAR